MKATTPQLDRENALTLLGVSATSTDDELRAAYLEKVRLYPPDRDPDMFERVRDAYQSLKDRTSRARLILVDGLRLAA